MRVIAGALGGRRLVAPGGARTRPTSDRVREALFMALEPLADLTVVDLFAGSGAMGIEALSRGARHVDFVEDGRAALVALENNLETLGIAERARVWRLSLPRGLERLRSRIESADLVLLDPPYGGELANATLRVLATQAGPHTRVVVEHHTKDEVPEAIGPLERIRQRRYGETMVTTYRREAATHQEEG